MADFTSRVNRHAPTDVSEKTHRKGATVWVPSQTKAWVKAEVMSWESATKVVVRSKDDGRQYTYSSTQVAPVNPVQQDGVNDNTQLMFLHEASLLHNTLFRYKKDKIYTYVANILIAVNPYKSLPIYTDRLIADYRGKSIGVLPPHVYAIADNAYRSMKRTGHNQSLLISGESGAGKTETAKIALRYFAIVGGSQTRGGNIGELENKILESNPILEAFGNAKTLRNNNSSRFGKFTQVHFDRKYRVSGASIDTYLLERARLVGQQAGERNFHIFYQLCAGASSRDRERFHLKDMKAGGFHYLNQGNKVKVDGINDKEDYQAVRTAMQLLGMSEQEQTDVLRVTAGVMWLGNIKFQAARVANEDGSKLANTGAAKKAAHLLGLDEGKLAHQLTTRQIKAGPAKRGDAITKALSVQQAEYSRDAFAKMIYARLFDKLVARINVSLSGKSRDFRISVLDIFGFEVFEENGFEQFCINYANEKLQQHFNISVLKADQEIYKREGIKWKEIQFDDNSDTIDVIENRAKGILSTLDEQGALGNSTDKTFTSKVHLTYPKHRRVGPPRTMRFKGFRDEEAIAINHFAGPVAYKTAGFLDKNNDTLSVDLAELVQVSSYKYLVELFPAQERKTNGPRKLASVTRKFSQQLETLMTELRATTSHFIRCIKPNNNMRPGEFNGPLSMGQLRFNGMVETLRVFGLGYPTRAHFQDLYDRYSAKMPRDIKALKPREFTEALLMGLEVSKDEFALGITRVFFKAGRLAFLDQLLGDDFEKIAPMVVEKVRRWLRRKRFRRAIWSVLAYIKFRDCLFDLRDGKRGDQALKSLGGNVPTESTIKAWFNQHLRNARFPRVLTNFTSDVQNGEKYLILLSQIEPDTCKGAAAAVKSMKTPAERAAAVLKYAKKADSLPSWFNADDITRGAKKLNFVFCAQLYNSHPQMEPAIDEKAMEEASKRVKEVESTMKKMERSLAMKEAEKKKLQKKAQQEVEDAQRRAMAEIQKSKSANAQLENRVEQLEEDKRRIETQWGNEIEEYKAKVRQLKEKLQQSSLQATSHQQELDETKFNLQTQLDELRASNSMELATLRAKVTELEQTNRTLAKEKAKLEGRQASELKLLRAKHQEVMGKYKDLQGEVKQLRSKGVDENKLLKQHLAKMKKTLEEVRAQLTTRTGERDSLAASVAALQAELEATRLRVQNDVEALKSHAAELESTLSTQKKEKSALAKELKSAESKWKEADAKARKAKGDKSALEENARKLADKMAEVQQRAEVLDQTRNDMEMQLDQLKVDRDNKQLEAQQLSSFLSSTEEAKALAQKRVGELDKALAREKASKRETKAEAQARVDELTRKLHATEDKMKLLQGEVNTYKQHLAQNEHARAQESIKARGADTEKKQLERRLALMEKQMKEMKKAHQREVSRLKQDFTSQRSALSGEVESLRAKATADAEGQIARLTSQLSAAETQLATLQKQISSTSSRKDKAEAKMHELELELVAKEGEVSRLEALVQAGETTRDSKLKDKDASNKRLKAETAKMADKVKKLTEQTTSLQHELSEAKSDLKEKQAEVKLLTKQLEQSQKQYREQMDKLKNDMRGFMERAKREADDAKYEASEESGRDAELAKLSGEKSGMEKLVETLKERAAADKAEKLSLRKRISALEAEKNTLEMSQLGTRGEQEAKLFRLENERSELQNREKLIKKDVKALVKKNKELDAKLKSAGEELADARDALDAAQSEATLLRNTLDKLESNQVSTIQQVREEQSRFLEKQRAEAAMVASQATSELEAARTEKERLAMSTSELRKENKQLSQELGKVRKSLETLETEARFKAEELSGEVDRLRSAVEKLEARKTELKDELKEARSDIKELQADVRAAEKKSAELKLVIQRLEAEKENVLRQADNELQKKAAELSQLNSKLGETETTVVRATQAAQLTRDDVLTLRHFLVLPEKAGFLLKQGHDARAKIGRGWQNRWVVIRSFFLFYYADNKALEKPQGVIDLTQVSISKVPYAAIKRRFVFVLKVQRSGVGYYFSAGGDPDLDDWYRVIDAIRTRQLQAKEAIRAIDAKHNVTGGASGSSGFISKMIKGSSGSARSARGTGKEPAFGESMKSSKSSSSKRHGSHRSHRKHRDGGSSGSRGSHRGTGGKAAASSAVVPYSASGTPSSSNKTARSASGRSTASSTRL